MLNIFRESVIVKTVQRSSFKFSPITVAIALAMTAQFAANVAQAGSGFGDGVDLSNAPVKVPTYYANSPSGPAPALTSVTGAKPINPVTGLPYPANTGRALRKFVDTLPGIPGVTPARLGGANFGVNNLGQYIPLAVPEKWVDLNGAKTTDDYYEIAAVEFSEQMHSDLPKATRLRGYVQLSTASNPGKKIPLFYPDGTKIFDAAGMQALAYDNPHHLGPVINSTRGTAVRVKFTNYLPTGTGGNLFVPVDTTITGAGTGPDGVTQYTQNRAEIHLVGGQTPWISAGTPHQWVAPAGEKQAYAAGLGKGVSALNVPDMADPGAGSTTLYFPNDMSARFMFIQDRTSGLTRLNSYAGLEAGYLVTDPIEQALVKAGTLPADQIPLIIEDKTFVPGNIAQQDGLWDTSAWGQAGDLWFPHVYEKNQDPNSIDGANPVGRWDFGPLFWPIFPANDTLPTGKLGDVSFTPEAFFDTPVINGTAYPTLTVDPKAYRFRILNASNDRYINLGLFKADGTVRAPQLDLNGNPIVDGNGQQQFLRNTEVKMVPAVGDASGNPMGWDNVNGVQLPQPQYPNLRTNINSEPSGPSRAWPVDGRPGGAPDPATSGPDFIVIGNDGGLLPNPVDIPSQPVTYEANRRSITIGNIYGYGMLLGPAERTDAIVDFSAYAGQTLILYNDAPAPNPFNDVRNDYYTGGPDLTASGGAYSTQPGYGPNTRTMMQIVVRGSTPAPAFNADALLTALPAAYGASQGAPIVPATAYNAAFGTNDTDIYAHVATGSAAQPTLDFSTAYKGSVTLKKLDLITSGGTVVAGGVIAGNVIPGSGTGYDPKNPPIVVFNNVVNGTDCLPGLNVAAGVASASATAVVDQGTPAMLNADGSVKTPAIPSTQQITKITNFQPGMGYTCAPTVTFQNPPGTNGIGAQVAVISSDVNFHSYPVLTKAEQELFDNRGRYNSTGGVELPMTNGVIQTTIPLNYIDAATETIADGEVQLWKLVDNGLWTNSMHFNFVDVQLINRVGWDGTVKAPATNEVGWKDTLRLNPLEDVIVAIRAKRATVPFGLPQSNRPLDPSQPLGAAGSGLGFTVDPNVTGPAPAGSPAGTVGPALLTTAVNAMANFDNEFVWNSALLSHSENDLTRPVIFSPTVIKPDAPSNLTDALGNGTLTWTDPTPAGAPATLANPKNELGFKIVSGTSDGNGYAWTAYPNDATQATVPANKTSWSIPAADRAKTFAVVAYNVAGDSAPSNPFTEGVPATPASFAATPTAYNLVTLTWDKLPAINGTLQFFRNGSHTPLNAAPLAWTAANFVDSTVAPATTYTYTVVATNQFGTGTATAASVTTPMIPVAAPTNLAATPNNSGAAVNLSWKDNANNETAYLVEYSLNAAPYVAYAQLPARAGTGGTVNFAAATTPAAKAVYTFRVTAINVTNGGISSSTSLLSAPVDLSAPAAPATAPVVALASQTATRANLSWGTVAGATSYVVQVSTDGGKTFTSPPQTTALTANPAIVAGNNYQFQVLAQTTKYGLTTQGLASNTVVVNTPPAASTTPVAAAGAATTKNITVSWTNASSNITGWSVERRPNTGPNNLRLWNTIVTSVGGSAPSYTFTDQAPAAGNYTYRVTAMSAAGTNGPATSNAVTAP